MRQKTPPGTGKIANTIVVSDTAYTLPPVFHGKSWCRIERRPGLCRVAGDCRSRTGAGHRAACLVVTAPPLRLRRCAKETGAAGGGDRDLLVAGGNSGYSDRRLPGGRVVERDRSGRGGESGRAVTTTLDSLSCLLPLRFINKYSKKHSPLDAHDKQK